VSEDTIIIDVDGLSHSALVCLIHKVMCDAGMSTDFIHGFNDAAAKSDYSTTIEQALHWRAPIRRRPVTNEG
jgi:hypothetical protein